MNHYEYESAQDRVTCSNCNNSMANSGNQAQQQPKHPLLTAYSAVNWIDFAIMMLYIAYIVGIEAASFLMIPRMVLLVGLLSIATSISGVVIAVFIFKHRLNKSKGRLVARCILWGLWIIIDIGFLVWFLRH